MYSFLTLAGPLVPTLSFPSADSAFLPFPYPPLRFMEEAGLVVAGSVGLSYRVCTPQQEGLGAPGRAHGPSDAALAAGRAVQ